MTTNRTKCDRCGYHPNEQDSQDYLMLVLDQDADRKPVSVALCKHCWVKNRQSDR